jgi:hypothetical protein
MERKHSSGRLTLATVEADMQVTLMKNPKQSATSFLRITYTLQNRCTFVYKYKPSATSFLRTNVHCCIHILSEKEEYTQ